MDDIDNKQNASKTKKDGKNITSKFKEVFFEAKSLGYETKIMRKILVLSKIDIDERLEQETLLDTYTNVLGIY